MKLETAIRRLGVRRLAILVIVLAGLAGAGYSGTPRTAAKAPGEALQSLDQPGLGQATDVPSCVSFLVSLGLASPADAEAACQAIDQARPPGVSFATLFGCIENQVVGGGDPVAALGACVSQLTPATSPSPAPASNPPPQASSATVSVTYQTGWNQISGPQGAVVAGNTGPLYTLRAGDTGYETVPPGTPLQAGTGYWAYFQRSTTVALPQTGPQTVTMTLPAGQWVLIGNPGRTVAHATGADIVYSYDPAAGRYTLTTTLAPGQGGWAFSAKGGTVTIAGQ